MPDSEKCMIEYCSGISKVGDTVCDWETVFWPWCIVALNALNRLKPGTWDSVSTERYNVDHSGTYRSGSGANISTSRKASTCHLRYGP